jgi:hypothetical protein
MYCILLYFNTHSTSIIYIVIFNLSPNSCILILILTVHHDCKFLFIWPLTCSIFHGPIMLPAVDHTNMNKSISISLNKNKLNSTEKWTKLLQNIKQKSCPSMNNCVGGVHSKVLLRLSVHIPAPHFADYNIIGYTPRVQPRSSNTDIVCKLFICTPWCMERWRYSSMHS